jgi:hypothetical protein
MTPAGGFLPPMDDPQLSTAVCSKCGLRKSTRAFSSDSTKIYRGGISSWCKQCQSTRNSHKRISKHGPRMCARGCGRKAISQRHYYCGPCRQQATNDRLQRRGKMSMWGLMLAREKEARRTERRRQLGLTTRVRGYDRMYEIERERAKPEVEAGRVACARCGLPIRPGQKWDLGHDDLDRSVIRGPEHRFSADCPAGGNRATSRHRKEREVQLVSRAW